MTHFCYFAISFYPIEDFFILKVLKKAEFMIIDYKRYEEFVIL